MVRVVTVARKWTSHKFLYNETKWQTLSKRRELITFKNFIKIVDNETPNYLKSLLPSTIGAVRLNPRRPDHFFRIRTRTDF